MEDDLETRIVLLCNDEVQELCSTVVKEEMERILSGTEQHTRAAQHSISSFTNATPGRHHNAMAPIALSSLHANDSSLHWTPADVLEHQLEGGCIAKSAAETWSLYMTLQIRFVKVPSDAMKCILEYLISKLLNDLRNNIDQKLLNPKKAWCLGHRDTFNYNSRSTKNVGGYNYLVNAKVHGAEAIPFPPLEYRMLSVGGGDLDTIGLVLSTLVWLKKRLNTQGVKGSDMIFEVSTFIEELMLLVVLEFRLKCHIHMRLMQGRRYHWKFAKQVQVSVPLSLRNCR